MASVAANKKGTKRKTRWRTLSIGDGGGGTAENDGANDGKNAMTGVSETGTGTTYHQSFEGMRVRMMCYYLWKIGVLKRENNARELIRGSYLLLSAVCDSIFM